MLKWSLITLSDKNSSDKSVEISAWCRKFCPTKDFVRRKFCPIFQYKSQAKIGQKCRNFGLVSKILSDEIFCPSKILSDELLSDKVPYIENKSNRNCKNLPLDVILLWKLRSWQSFKYISWIVHILQLFQVFATCTVFWPQNHHFVSPSKNGHSFKSCNETAMKLGHNATNMSVWKV